MGSIWKEVRQSIDNLETRCLSQRANNSTDNKYKCSNCDRHVDAVRRYVFYLRLFSMPLLTRM